MPYFGTRYFSSDEKLLNISVCCLQDTRHEMWTRNKSVSPLLSHSGLSLLGPNWLRIVSNDHLRSDAGTPGDLATIRVTMIRPRLNRSSHDMWPSSSDGPGQLRDISVTTAWENADWLADTRILSVKRANVSMEISSSFSCLYFVPG